MTHSNITDQTIQNPSADGWRLGDIWGVRNYHTTLEKRAIAGATMTGGYISMVVAAFVIGASISAFITIILQHYVSGITITHEILLWAMPTEKYVVLTTLIAISAGAAA
jgi:hypothetical protein